jgi:hypothetical protein
MKLTGHQIESVYRRYAIVSESDLSEGVKKLARLHDTAVDAPRVVVPLSEVGQAKSTPPGEPYATISP